MFSEDRGFQHALVVSFGVPFGCEKVSVSVRAHAENVRCVVELGSAGSMDHPAHNGLLSLGCHGDGGGSALVQYCLSLRCSCCCQQISHSFAAVVAVDDGVVDAVAFLETSLTGCPALRWTLQTLYYQLQH